MLFIVYFFKQSTNFEEKMTYINAYMYAIEQSRPIRNVIEYTYLISHTRAHTQTNTHTYILAKPRQTTT